MNVQLTDSFRLQLKKAIALSGLSIEIVSEQFEVTRPTISRWLNGHTVQCRKTTFDIARKFINKYLVINDSIDVLIEALEKLEQPAFTIGDGFFTKVNSQFSSLLLYEDYELEGINITKILKVKDKSIFDDGYTGSFFCKAKRKDGIKIKLSGNLIQCPGVSGVRMGIATKCGNYSGVLDIKQMQVISAYEEGDTEFRHFISKLAQESLKAIDLSETEAENEDLTVIKVTPMEKLLVSSFRVLSAEIQDKMVKVLSNKLDKNQ